MSKISKKSAKTTLPKSRHQLKLREGGRSCKKEKMCEFHGQKNEVFCFKCRKQICTKCALFGNHKVRELTKQPRGMISRVSRR